MVKLVFSTILDMLEILGAFVSSFYKIILLLFASMSLMIFALIVCIFTLDTAVDIYLQKYHDNRMMTALGDLPPPAAEQVRSEDELGLEAVNTLESAMSEKVYVTYVTAPSPTQAIVADADTAPDTDVEIKAASLPPLTNIAERPFVAGKLAIPEINLDQTIKLIPFEDNTWDVDNLGKEIGLLGETGEFPGDRQSMVFAAHVSTERTFFGPFAYLATLEEGSEITYTVDGNEYVYHVKTRKRVLPSQGSLILQEKPDQIILLTCIGYNESEDSYAERLLVEAKLVKIRAVKPTEDSS